VRTGSQPPPPPEGRWLRTKREGEQGENVTMLMRRWDGEEEWCDRMGRTTTTHSTFLPPTYWRNP